MSLLSEEIKSLLDRTTGLNYSDVSFVGWGLIATEDIKILVELLNQYPNISKLDLSRNCLYGKNSVLALAQLRHVKELRLISSDVDCAGALILCSNENFRELELDSRALGKGSLDELRIIHRTNPLKIIVTRGIDFQRHMDTIIELGPQAEITAISNAEIAIDAQTVDEKNRKKNNSDESTASKSTAPMSVNSTTAVETPSNALSCCPLSFGWGSSNKQAPLSPSTPGAGK